MVLSASVRDQSEMVILTELGIGLFCGYMQMSQYRGEDRVLENDKLPELRSNFELHVGWQEELSLMILVVVVVDKMVVVVVVIDNAHVDVVVVDVMDDT